MTVEDSDDELLVRAGRGDRAAFSRLVERHEGRLMAVASRLTGSRAAAEDAAQEAFTRAWTQAPRWRPRVNGRAGVGAWLARVVVNIAIDAARRTPMRALEEADDPPDPALPADEAMIARERQARLRAAMNSLPERQRIAVSLTYDGGLSNAQGARAMETSVGAFELLLVRARRALRAALTEDDSA